MVKERSHPLTFVLFVLRYFTIKQHFTIMFSCARQQGQNVLPRSLSRRAFTTSISCMRGAADKRIPVQLLRDFPDLGFKGEIVSVPPGRMRNQLHRGNGAAYVLKGEPLRIPLVSREKIMERQRAEAAEKVAEESAQLEAQLLQERVRATGRINSQNDMLNALESLTNLNFNFPSKDTGNEAQVSPDQAVESDSFFLEASIKNLPTLIPLQANAQSTGFITPHVTSKTVADRLQSLLDITIDPSLISFKVLVDRGSPLVDSTVIDFVGTYNLSITISPDRIITKKLRVTPKDTLEGWEQLRRPFGHPLPGSTPVDQPEEAVSEAAVKTENSSDAIPSSEAKTFDWENDFIVNLNNNKKRN